MRWIAAIMFILIGCTTTSARGDNFNTKFEIKKEINLQESSIELTPFPGLSSVNLIDSLTIPRAPPNQYIEYKGLEGLIANRAASFIGRYFQQTQENYWKYGNLNLADYQNWLLHEYDSSQDFQFGQWWNRSFQDSLNTAERSNKLIIGKEIEIVSWQEFSVLTTGRVRAGTIQFYLEKLSPRVNENLNKISIKNDQQPTLGIRLFPVNSTQRGNVYTGTNWSLSVTPKVSLKFSKFYEPNTILGSFEVEAKAKFFTPKKLIANLSLNFKGNPIEKNYSGTIYFELFTF